jgi:ATP-dependent Lon protease
MFERSRTLPATLPIYPIREQVVFPHMVLPLYVASEGLPVINEALRKDHLLGVVVTTGTTETCRFEELAGIGTVCRINQIFRLPEGGAKIMVEGVKRIRLIAPAQVSPFLVAVIEVEEERKEGGLVAEALVQSVNALLKIALAHGRPLPGDVLKMVDQIEDPGRLADLVTVYLGLDLSSQQRLLGNLDPLERLKEVYLHLTSEVQKLQVQGEVQSEVAKRVGRTQKEYLLREQLKQIQEELGEEDPRQAESSELRGRIARSGMPEQVLALAEKELARLDRINPSSPEYTVSRGYLEYLCSVPWSSSTEDNLDISTAQQVLDSDHYDLKEVKERILEFLAVRSLKNSSKGPILCFVGPPGVGKTSLGRSIARAMERRFIRISLGGMKDEAEIRGHRRTYIGAMPGRIIQEICRAEANNPVFMLDEVDKIGQDFRGDPAAALLEVLDPEQNYSFTDHYLDVPFDLSGVMFITTANIMEPIPHALRDRMEVIHLAGYSDEEKVQIAFTYLIPKQLRENGLANNPLEFAAEAVRKIIREYTREAGVRNLERQIAAICRKVAREITQSQRQRQQIAAGDIEGLLGGCKFFADAASQEDQVGVATGLAWTESGGDIIFVEASRMAGKKEFMLTGSLGEVMQESARAALSYVRAQAAGFGIDPEFFDKSDIHVHVPSGAIPKDGPSAGVTIAAALISLLTGRPARRDIAMTGELTLSGRILPVGGVKEKVLAARRAGVNTVLLPARNRENLRDLDEHVGQEMSLIFMDSMDEVIGHVLLPAILPREATHFPAQPIPHGAGRAHVTDPSRA